MLCGQKNLQAARGAQRYRFCCAAHHGDGGEQRLGHGRDVGRKAPFQQTFMVLPVIGGIQGHGNQRETVAHGGCHQTASAFLCEACFDADHTDRVAKQAIVVEKEPTGVCALLRGRVAPCGVLSVAKVVKTSHCHGVFF